MVGRLPQLDFLRGASILLVLGVHHSISTKWMQMGWLGVDIFFVLSGFLVSGLLFGQYIKNGKIEVGKFLIRRGLKIYPMFYFFVLTTLFVRWVGNRELGSQQTVVEIFYLQNYLKGLWLHTWSLAVEEHFYIFLALLIAYLATLKNNLKWLAPSVAFIAVLCLALRLYTSHLNLSGSLPVFSLHEKFMKQVSPTHLRIDSLFFGVLLAYLYFFHREKLAYLVKKTRWVLIVIVVGLCFVVSNFHMFNSFTLTFGFTINYLTFGMLLLLLLHHKETYNALREKQVIGFVVAKVENIGLYSYGIYLWHLPVEHWIILPMERLHIGNHLIQSATYVILSIAVGILTTLLVERPVLRIREKYFA